MKKQSKTAKTPNLEPAVEEHTFNYFDVNQHMKMVSNMLSITSTQMKIFGEIFEKEGHEIEKTATPMKNVCDIAVTAPPHQTHAVLMQTMKEATSTYLTNLTNFQDAAGFFCKEVGKALLNGPQALEKFAENFALTEENNGAGLRKKQSEIRYGLRDTEKQIVYETEHFNVFEILPDPDSDDGLAGAPREKVKPMVFFLPPVLGSDVAALSEKMNLLKYFANKGIPVYVADLKPIDTTEAVQNISMDDYTTDMATITAQMHKKHGKPSTVVGYCMGGALTTSAISSGEVKSADALFRIVSPGGGEGMFDKLLQGVPPAYSGTKTAHKLLPNGNKVIDGLTLQRVISDVDETVLPPTSQYFQSMKRTFKNVQQGRKGISEKGAAIQYFLNGGHAGSPPNVPVGLSEVSFKMAHAKIDDDGSMDVAINGRPINLRNLPKYVRVVNFLGSKDNVTRISDSVGPMHKTLRQEYKKDKVQDVIKPVGHLAYATDPDKHLEHAIDTQAQLTYKYNLLEQLENEVGVDFLKKNKIKPGEIIGPQTLPDKTIDLLISSLEKLETANTAERDSNIKYLRQEKIWNSLVDTLGKEFLAEHQITCEMITGRMSMPPEADEIVSDALRKMSN